MRNFAHIDAASLEEAVEVLKRYGKRASIIAGGDCNRWRGAEEVSRPCGSGETGCLYPPARDGNHGRQHPLFL